MLDQSQILLQTKLHPPRLPKDLIGRSRLVELLEHSLDRQLIMICAPAGFGKSTLIATWLQGMAAGKPGQASSLPSAWLSLDENDSDLNLFLRYFIAALRTIFNEACPETLALLQARQAPPQALLHATFSNELEQLPGEFILVLDDYHTIRSAEVHNLLGEWVRHWPGPLHLVLSSRISPPVALAGLRAKGMISEIRTRDLRFTPEETADYLSRSQFALMARDALPRLEERFEGWPAGLRLATLSLRSASAQESVLSALSTENADITGYLMDEVLTNLDPAIHSFLLKTSVLDRFCPSLCEAILGETDAQRNARACLDWIERAELFIIPLDDRREWYRYHHLFQELLQQRLSVQMGLDQAKDLHVRASTWFEENGLLDEGLHHALAAGDIDLAAHQIATGLRDALNREDRPTLERWLRLLPEEMIKGRPELLMVRAWVYQFSWRLDLQAKAIQQAEALLDSGAAAPLAADEQRILRGQILLVKAEHAYFSNQPALAIDLCRQVLELLPPAWSFARGGAMIYLGMSMQASGTAPAAERLLLDEYESYGNKTDIYALFLLQSLCFIYLQAGRLEQARKTALLLVQMSTHSGVALMNYWGDWFLGVVCYQRNELEAAAEYFSEIFEHRYIAQISPYRDAVAGLALIYQLKGENSAAWQLVETIDQFDLEQSGREDSRTRSLRARLMLSQGDLENACQWVETFTSLPPDQPLLWFEEPQLTRVRILLARGADADLRAALQILDVLQEITERTFNVRYRVEILALRALALDAQGETSQAEAALNQALELAKVGGFIRAFADLGKPMQDTINRLARQDHAAGALRSILAAFPQDGMSPGGVESLASRRRRASLAIPGLTEALTPRELEVLDLLRGPLSIKQIALRLNISHATAKRHTINLYRKLGVNGRWEAIARAEELEILPPR